MVFASLFSLRCDPNFVFFFAEGPFSASVRQGLGYVRLIHPHTGHALLTEEIMLASRCQEQGSSEATKECLGLLAAIDASNAFRRSAETQLMALNYDAEVWSSMHDFFFSFRFTCNTTLVRFVAVNLKS